MICRILFFTLTIICAQLNDAFAACTERSDVEGLYALKLNVGGKDFVDLININKACHRGKNEASLEGNLTVPELFTTKIVDSSLRGQNYKLKIDTLERGRPLKATYTFSDTVDSKTKQHKCLGQVTFEGEKQPVSLTCFKFSIADKYTP